MTTPVPDQYFCDKCGRVLLSSSPHYKHWLVSEDKRVIRCPQHITDWSMRCAKVRRTKTTYEWRRIAKEKDNPPSNILYEPFFDL
jgi:hypothetical protein